MQIISLTFDDGLRCQIERALPVLDQRGLPATFFIAANTSPVHLDYCPHAPWQKIEWSPDDCLVKSVSRRASRQTSRLAAMPANFRIAP